MALEAVKQSCMALKSEKVTERKNGSLKLRSLLNNASIISCLNARPPDAFNWSQVFLSARKYFLMEARKLEEDERNKPNVSQTVLSNRANHKRTAASLPFVILKEASRATPHIAAQLVIDFVLKGLSKREPYLLENFAGEFLQIMLKFVLRFRSYYCEMTAQNWKDLLKVCIWLYEKSVPNADPKTIFQVMAGIVRHCQTRVDHQTVPVRLEVLRYLPAFLRRSLLSEKLKSSSNFTLRTSLLELMLAFASTMACEWRQLLCHLGEDTFDAILSMWDDRSSAKQTHWLEYMTLLVALHHPQKDGRVVEGSQYWGDKDRWERCLRHLYQLLYDHLARRCAGGGGEVVSRELLTLTSRVCLQIFAGSETTGYINVTQISIASTSTSTGTSSTGSSSKRRKIEVGLLPLTELLRTDGALPHTLPWHEVLFALLKEHPHFFNERSCLLVLETLKQVLASCTDPGVQDVVMRSLGSLAKQYGRVVATSQQDTDDPHDPSLWPAVWDVTLRLVSGRQSSTSGLNLMATLILIGLVTPEASAFELFHQNYLETSKEALWTLLALLSTVPLPRRFENEPSWIQKSEAKDVRERLILYALPTHSSGVGGGCGSAGVVTGVVGALKDPHLLARVLGRLCTREPHSVKINHHHNHNHNHNNNHHHNLSLVERTDELFHLSTFTCELPAAAQVTPHTCRDPSSSSSSTSTPTKPTGGGGGGGGGFLGEKLEFMIQQVMKFADKVEAEDSSSSEGLEALIHLAHLLIHVHLTTADDRLKVKFSHIMRLVTSSLERVCAGVGGEASPWHILHPMLACLLQLFVEPEEDKEEEEVREEEEAGGAGRVRRKQILSSTPPTFFTVMLSVIEKRCVKSGPAAGPSQLPRGNSMTQNSFDDFDLDFDDSLPSSSDAIKDELMDFEDDRATQAEDEQPDENITVDDVTTLSQRDRCVVLAGRCVVEAVASVAQGGGGGGEHAFLHRAVDVMLQMSLSSTMEMCDVAVLLAFVQSLFVAEYSEDNILDGLEMISNVAKVHCGVAQVARAALHSLAELIHRHGICLSPDIRSSMLTLTKAFAIKQRRGCYDHTVTKAIFCVNVELTKADPKRQWSYYEIPDHDRCCKTHDLLCNDSHDLRVAAATATHLLLVANCGRGGGGGSSGVAAMLDTAHQDRVFEEVYQMVLEALNVVDLPNEELVPDEKRNRISTFLLALGTVVLVSPYQEPKALFALCLSIPVYKIDPSLLLQLLKCIAKSRGTSPRAILASNLPYLTSQWFQHHYDITDFPSKAFGYATTQEFLSENRNALLPVLLECDQRAAIDTLVESCNKGVREVFEDAFALVMARVFPYIAAEQVNGEGLQVPDVKIQAGKRQYKLVERTLGTESFTTMLTGHIGDITLHLLRLVHDPHPWVEDEVVVPPPPPSFPPEAIHATMKFVGGIFRQDGVLFVFLSSRRHELHKVVLGVVEHLARATSPHTARQAIAAAATLVEAVLPLLSSGLAQVAHYLLRMLLHLLTCRLAHLAALAPHLAQRCTGLLHRLVGAALATLPTHLLPSLPMLFGRLLPLLTQPRGVVAGGAARVLRLLLDTDHPEVRATLATLPALPSLPDTPELAALRDQHHRVVATCRGRPDLLDEADNFLAAPQEAVATHHLTHLTTLVRATREQVAELFSGAGPGQESRGHRLAQRLVCLAGGAKEEVALEACRCLGELGPLSLATPVFLTREGVAPQNQVGGEVDLGYVGRIVVALHGYLTSGDVAVEGAASQALLGVLATHHGHLALQELPPTTVEELRPLLPEGRPRAGCEDSGGVDAAAYQHIVGDQEVWMGRGEYEGWVCGLARTLITAGCGRDLASPLLPLCALRPEFSALVLPFLVHSALNTGAAGRKDVLSRHFNAFFARHCEGGPAMAPGGVGQGRAAVQALLAVVEYLRQQQQQPQGRRATTPFQNNLWLDLNYLHVAGAAHHCGAHFSALLYLQLHHEQMLRDTPPERGHPALTRRLQAPPSARVTDHPEARAAGRLLLEVYGALGDGAGVEGCLAAGGVLDTPARLMRCQQRGEWLAAMAVCDAAHHRPAMLDTLAALGLYNTLGGVLATATHAPQTGRAQWEAAWRLCHWEEDGAEWGPARGCRGGEEGRLQQHMFEAMRSLYHHDTKAILHHTNLARTTITTTLANSRAESTSLIHPLLTHLQILNEVEDIARCLQDLSTPGEVRRIALEVEEGWGAKEAMGCVRYKEKEVISAARISVLRALIGVCKEEKELPRILHRTLLAKSRLAREEGDKGGQSVVASESAILWAAQLAVPPEMANLTRLEEAEVARAAGDVQRAKHTLQSLLTDMEGQQRGQGQEKVQCQVLTLLGELIMDSRSLPPHTIIQDYFHRATSTLLHQSTDPDIHSTLEHSHQRLAKYVDQLYQQVHSHLESEASQAKRSTIRRSQEELARLSNLVKGCREHTNEWKELSKKRVLLQRNIGIDLDFLSELEKEKKRYLLIALKSYLSCLATTSTHDLLTYRLVALWLENCDKDDVNVMMSELGSKVKTHHFVPLLYQLVARLSTQHSHQPLSFPLVLSHLLVRVCVDHPHHALPVIYALAHAHADDSFNQRRKTAEVSEEDRVQAAKLLVEKLKKMESVQDHVVEFERISLAYLSLANWCTSLGRLQAGDKVELPHNQPLRNLTSPLHTASLTLPLKLQPSAQYSPPLIVEWEKSGMCVGGINAPLRLTLRTSDGGKHFELLKGKDDVRQDAVMEQVFGIVNELLTRSGETRDCGLSVRTYQVVPLSQRSGLIQWCKNTQAFGRYLIGADKKSGAHKTYFPKDYTARTCLEKMKAAKENSAEEKMRIFLDILEHFHPVFHHFFLENYPSPQTWHQRRLAYTKSVATNSMVGYILGLGDRHPENILLDKTTAELIHIDLGIAFELGKVLPTPETVPFRMTQDIVAGLGVLGVEGPLRGWCEATLRILRSSAEVLVTLVEVLRHDPLHQWTLTPQQAAKLQAGEEVEGLGCPSAVSMAERVVLKVRQKLVGMEDGFPRSVTHQVTRLLQEATDPTNLSRLFAGWQPYV